MAVNLYMKSRKVFFFFMPHDRSLILHSTRFLFSFFGHALQFWGISVPQSGTEPRPTTVKAPSPNHWTPREFPATSFLIREYS